MNVTETSTSLIPSSSTANSSQSISTQSNSTQSSSSESSPTQRLWDLRWFVILAVPLVLATIIVPLIAGPFIRWLLQTSLKLRRYWRFFVVPVAVVYIICYYIYLNGHPLVNRILYSIWDLSVLLIGFVWWCKAVRDGERRTKWSLFMAFTLTCTLIDELVTEPFLMGILAWSILFFMLLFSYGYFERVRQISRRVSTRLAALFAR